MSVLSLVKFEKEKMKNKCQTSEKHFENGKDYVYWIPYQFLIFIDVNHLPKALPKAKIVIFHKLRTA